VTKLIVLSEEKPFAQGGNRLCFVHPENANLCIKVRRPDFSLADRRRKKGFPKNLKPLSSFDDNQEEWRVMQSFEKHLDADAFQLLSRCYGFVETDLGLGLVSDLIRDDLGTISETLKKCIWDNGINEDISAAVKSFAEQWQRYSIPSRDLLLHNIVVQKHDGKIKRLVVIDGLGSAGIVPFHWLTTKSLASKARRKTANLYERIDVLLDQRGQDKFPGYHGLLLHTGRTESSNSGGAH